MLIDINELTVFVFVRNDLPLGQDDIQTNHACLHLGMRIGNRQGIPYLITKEKLNAKSLQKLAQKCASMGVLHYVMTDTDIDEFNPTALAVMPDKEQQELFRKYPLRNYSRSEKSEDLFVGLDARAGANAVVAQKL